MTVSAIWCFMMEFCQNLQGAKGVCLCYWTVVTFHSKAKLSNKAFGIV